MKWLAAFLMLFASAGGLANQQKVALDLATFKPAESWVSGWNKSWTRLGENDSVVVYYMSKADDPDRSPSVFSANRPNTDIGVLVASKGLGSDYAQLQVVTGIVACGPKGSYPTILEFSHTKNYNPVTGGLLYLDDGGGLGVDMPIQRGTILAKVVLKVCDAVAAG